MTDTMAARSVLNTAAYVPESRWGVLTALMATAIICLGPVAVFLVGISVLAATGVLGANADGAIGGLSSLATPQGVALAAGTQLFSLWLVWVFAGRGGLRVPTLRLFQPIGGAAIYLTAAVILIVATGALEFLLYKLADIDIFADTKWLREGLDSPLFWATAIVAIVFAPLWEELAFRGFLMSALAQSRIGLIGAVLISNTLWTLLHWGYSWPGLLSVFTAGLVLSWAVVRSGSIWPAIFAHAVGNTVALAFTYAFAPVTA